MWIIESWLWLNEYIMPYTLEPIDTYALEHKPHYSIYMSDGNYSYSSQSDKLADGSTPRDGIRSV